MKLQLYLQKALSKSYALPTKKQFVAWTHCALETILPSWDHFKAIELTIRMVEEEESSHFNQKYRDKSGPTNILSFSAENFPQAESYYLGDLLICVPLVFKEAFEEEKTPMAHWAHLTVHGILHLLNYDHQLKSEAQVMEGLEITILKQLGYEDPYEESG